MTPSPHNPRAALFQDSNFRWMVSGTALTMLGDQFTLIALPWLVLQMTGDTLVLGTVLALMSVPRALFILIGGALVDRHSPKQVLMLTKYANLALLGVLSALVLAGALTLWMVYALSLAIGLATAFSIPAGTAMLPHVVPRAQLQAANGISMGIRQLTMFLGPLLAGLLIALFGDGSGGAGTGGSGAMANAPGIGVAFGLDALSFGLSAWTLSKVRLLPAAPAASAGATSATSATSATGPAAPGSAPSAVLASVAQGLAHFWRDRELRTCFLYWSAVAVLIMGPLHIAMPVLASSLPHLGAAAFGMLVGAHGAGTLAGMVASGMLPRLRWGSLGMTLLAFDATIGLLFMPMGVIGALWQGIALMLAIGLLGGFMQVRIFTWIQQRVPPALIGRAMALFMFIFMGLAPISAAITGWVMKGITLAQLFAGCGGALVVVAALAFMLTPLRQVNDAPGTAAR
ncbi:MFS transporter [Paracidovorax valerianellae]|uniref:Major Facilitator Superfamily protein n=1 Tax=Paracidovorax valerianellae TaxID=187868 RepID=A0A1G6UVS7_9BURK|nr:MFS transporter [Paracidovorax valerianellae]MDA8446907.1 MFS transporter [Paracidovorax valerianellae]SDD45381.1 Major Facilitator Superfamily protein [Paracidovorax valerianellae]